MRVSRHAANQGGLRMGLRAGERLSINRLLMGMAVSSGNDASMAVAERVAGCKQFVKLMNAKARQVGMRSSTFKTPNGLPAPGRVHHGPRHGAFELRLSETPPFRAGIPPRARPQARGAVTTNKNPLRAPPARTACKRAGSASGYNIISTVRRGNTRLIAVILGAESPADRSREIRRLVEAGFQSRAKGISVASALSKQKNVQYAPEKAPKSHNGAAGAGQEQTQSQGRPQDAENDHSGRPQGRPQRVTPLFACHGFLPTRKNRLPLGNVKADLRLSGERSRLFLWYRHLQSPHRP
ncbi:MAG: hypothetical protein V8Q84_08230 [Bilophila sp.]